MGKRIDYVLRIADLQPGRLLEMRSVKAPFPMQVTYAFDDAPGGTVTSVRVQGEPASMYKIAGPMLTRQTTRSVGSDLRTLKTLMEHLTGDRGGAE